jgi:ubiquinone/menaquinone biosynthesis C-methylase UbiE
MRGIEHIPWLYDAFMAVSDRCGLARWREWLARGSRGRTLEVGCGTGRNFRFFPPDIRLVALDPDPGLLRAARRRSPEVPLVAARAEALPFADASFDTVVSSLVFCSVEAPVRGLEEIRRVLAAGGELRMMEHVRSTRRLGARWQDFIQPAWTAVTGGCRPNRATEAHVEAAGLRIDPLGRRARGTMRRFVARAG